MVGYEIYYAPDLGVFAGTGAGYDGPRELSGWYTDVFHTADITPHVTGGSAASTNRRRADQRRFLRWRRRKTNPGEGCTDQTFAVLAQLVNVARTDVPVNRNRNAQRDVDPLQGVVLGTCYTYSARVDGTITVDS